MFKSALMKTASRLASFGRQEDGAVAMWYAILLIPMLGFTFGAIRYTELSEQRTNMTDAMDASALAMARWVDFNNKDVCQVATGNRPQDLEDREEVVRYAREFFDKNYPMAETLFADKDLTVPFEPKHHLDFDLTCSKITVKADAYKDMGGVLARYFDVGAVPLRVSSEITLAGAGRVEIALVLDLSGSMNKDIHDKYGNTVAEEDEEGSPTGSNVTRMGGLKTAIAGMLEELFGETDDAENEFVRIGVVPFNSIVNVGRGIADENLKWFDGSSANGDVARAPWHGEDFVHAEYDDSKTYRAQKMILAQRKVNHFDLFDSVPGVSWAGCVEALPFPLDELPRVPGSSLDEDGYDAARAMPPPPTGESKRGFKINPKANAKTKQRIMTAWSDVPAMSDDYVDALDAPEASRFVPWFYPDEADCRDLPRWHECRPWDNEEAEDRGNTVDSWYKAYYDEDDEGDRDGDGDDDALDYTALLSHPKGDFTGGDSKGNSRNDPYHMWRYENLGFIRDRNYIDFVSRDSDATKYYHDFTLDWKNSWRMEDASHWCGLTPAQRAFHRALDSDGNLLKFDGQDDDEALAASKRMGISSSADCALMEHRMRQAYVGIWDDATKTYKHKYDFYKSKDRFKHQWERNNRFDSAGDPVGPNFRCGEPLLPLTSKKEVVADYVEALEPDGGTNSAIGMAWGWRMLTPEAPLEGAVDLDTPAGKKWRKFAILMSDGKNNLNSRRTANLTTRAAYGYGFQDRLNIVTESNPDGDDVTEKYDEEIDHKTIRICNRMQADGIKIFTVGYGLNREKNSTRKQKIIDMLKACGNSADGTEVVDGAGNPTGVTFINADTPEQLQKAFEDITDAIEELHISG